MLSIFPPTAGCTCGKIHLLRYFVMVTRYRERSTQNECIPDTFVSPAQGLSIPYAQAGASLVGESQAPMFARLRDEFPEYRFQKRGNVRFASVQRKAVGLWKPQRIDGKIGVSRLSRSS